MLLDLEGPISPASATYVARGIAEAETTNAALVLLRLDTPGGLASSMRSIVKEILNATIPVVVFVAPQGAGAASAGVLVTVAAHVAAMAPGTNIGAAHPVDAGGKDIEKTLSEKIVNDMASYGRGIAEGKGRNGVWVEKAIRESVSVTAEEALALGVVDLLAGDVEELLKRLDGREVRLTTGPRTLRTGDLVRVPFTPDLRDRVLKILGDPNISYILMMVGLAGLYFELSNPGAIFPGVIGALSLILAFYSFQTLPVNAAGLLLIGLGILCFLVEIKVTSYGLLSIGGLLCLSLGSLMLFEETEVGLAILIPSVLLVGGFFVVCAGLAFRAGLSRPKSGREGMLGEIGTVSERIAPEGRVFVHGESWKARATVPIEVGENVRVVAVEGLVLRVEREEGLGIRD